MPATLNVIASAIDTNVRSGVKGVANFSYSMEQLEKEVVFEWASIVEILSKKPLFRADGFTQEINELTLDAVKLSKTTGNSPGDAKLHFRIPALLTALEERAVDYIGPVSREGFSWRVYIGADHVLHKFRAMTKGRPYVYIDPAVGPDGYVDGWLMNYRGTAKHISVSAIFSDPELIKDFGPPTIEDIVFPAPDETIKILIERLSNKYLQYYRKLRAPAQNNDQIDKAS